MQLATKVPAAPLQLAQAVLYRHIARQVAPVVGHSLGGKGALPQRCGLSLQPQLLPLQTTHTSPGVRWLITTHSLCSLCVAGFVFCTGQLTC